MEIINPTTEREGRRYRIYSAPKYCTLGGLLRPIEDVLNVSRDSKTGEYRVSCGDEWITLRPQMTKGVRVDSVVSPWRFGDVLQAESGYEDVIGYDVAHSPSVSVAADGWKFGNVTDVALGAFFGDWETKWPGKVMWKPDSVSLDTRAIEPVDGLIDLDPVTVSATNAGSYYSSNHATWAAAIGDQVAVTTSSDTAVQCKGQVETVGYFLCLRGFLKFEETADIGGKLLADEFPATPFTMVYRDTNAQRGVARERARIRADQAGRPLK